MSVRKHKPEQIVLTSLGTNFGLIHQSADSPALLIQEQQRKSLIATTPEGGKGNEQIPRSARDDTSQCFRWIGDASGKGLSRGGG